MKNKHITYYTMLIGIFLIATLGLNLKTHRIKRNISDHISEEIEKNRKIDVLMIKYNKFHDTLFNIYNKINGKSFDGYDAEIRDQLNSLNNFNSIKINKFRSNISILKEIMDSSYHFFEYKFNPVLIIDEFEKFKKDSIKIKLSLFIEYIDSPNFKLYFNNKEIAYEDLKKIKDGNPKLKAIFFNPITKETIEYEYK